MKLGPRPLVAQPRPPQPAERQPQSVPSRYHFNEGPWLDETDAMRHVGHKGSVRSFRMTCRRAGIKPGKFGRANRYRQFWLDAAIEAGRWARRRRVKGAA